MLCKKNKTDLYAISALNHYGTTLIYDTEEEDFSQSSTKLIATDRALCVIITPDSKKEHLETAKECSNINDFTPDDYEEFYREDSNIPVLETITLSPITIGSATLKNGD